MYATICEINIRELALSYANIIVLDYVLQCLYTLTGTCIILGQLRVVTTWRAHNCWPNYIKLKRTMRSPRKSFTYDRKEHFSQFLSFSTCLPLEITNIERRSKEVPKKGKGLRIGGITFLCIMMKRSLVLLAAIAYNVRRGGVVGC